MINQPTAKSLFESWLTVKLLADAEPAFTQAAIRSLVFNADDRRSSHGVVPGNGLAPHIRRVNSKVLLNHGGFLSWIDGSAKHRRERTDTEVGEEKAGECSAIPGLALPNTHELDNSRQARRRRT